jgi:dTDP-4-dehydrorhamnose reductase
MERLLVTGASGFLGSNLALILKDRYDIFGAYHHNPISIDGCQMGSLDIRDADETRALVRRITPQIVVHCATEARVDYCEDNPQEAHWTNVVGTKNISTAAAEAGSKFVYISTDSVFDGAAGHYTEQSETNPLNTYARTKLAAEETARKYAQSHLVVRTNFYGWNIKPNSGLAEWALDRLRNQREVPGFADIYFSPLLINDLGQLLGDILGMGLQGTYHAGTREVCSKLGFIRMLCRGFEEDQELIIEAHSDQAGFKARRPKDTSLDVAKLELAMARPMPGILEGIERFRRLAVDGYVERLRLGVKEEVS